MKCINRIIEEAKKLNKIIVLPEATDKRVLEAAEIVLNERIANVILLGNKDEIKNSVYKLDDAIVIDPNNSELTSKYIDELVALRSHKGMTKEEAQRLLLTDYMYYACMLVRDKRADGVVSGACHSSSNTLRPALQIIKAKPNEKIVSGFFLMVVPGYQYGDGVFVFADCGLIQNPNSEELAAIAYQSANSFKNLTGTEAKVAMLSHSTKGSAKHADVDKVVRAVEIAKENYQEILLDGELQLDAAIIPEIARLKAPNSNVAGYANVLVFPDLDSGNIGYKLVERLANAEAYGPLTQGMVSPINDLSRGCSVKDIVGVVAITVLQAQNNNN